MGDRGITDIIHEPVAVLFPPVPSRDESLVRRALRCQRAAARLTSVHVDLAWAWSRVGTRVGCHTARGRAHALGHRWCVREPRLQPRPRARRGALDKELPTAAFRGLRDLPVRILSHSAGVERAHPRLAGDAVAGRRRANELCGAVQDARARAIPSATHRVKVHRARELCGRVVVMRRSTFSASPSRLGPTCE